MKTHVQSIMINRPTINTHIVWPLNATLRPEPAKECVPPANPRKQTFKIVLRELKENHLEIEKNLVTDLNGSKS